MPIDTERNSRKTKVRISRPDMERLFSFSIRVGDMSAVLGIYTRADAEFDRGEGAHLWTSAGERYLDFAAGVAVNVLGHAHPHLVQALTAQAHKLWHTSNLYRITGQERLAARLTEITFAE